MGYGEAEAAGKRSRGYQPMTEPTVLLRGPAPQKKKQPQKSPVTAALLAAGCPGAGQMWVGHWKRGLLYFGFSLFCCLGYFIGIFDAYRLAELANRGETTSTDDYVLHAYVTLPVAFLVIVVGLTAAVAYAMWGMIEQYLSLLEQASQF
jgi:hypothetical protein